MGNGWFVYRCAPVWMLDRASYRRVGYHVPMLLTLCILALAAVAVLALLGGVALIAYFSGLAGGQVVRVLGLAGRRQQP